MTVEDEVMTLTLKDVDLNDAGVYKCEASSKLGRVETEGKVQVHGQHHRFIFSSINFL
jgi:hypothetical protein